MNPKIDINQVNKLAETLELFIDHQAMLMSFLPALEMLVALLQQEKSNLIDNNLRLSEADCELYESTAQLYSIINYNCVNNEPTPQSIKFAQVARLIEFLLMTIVQHCKGGLDPSKGYFYASEDCLAGLCDASLDVLEVTDATKPIKFVQIA